MEWRGSCVYIHALRHCAHPPWGNKAVLLLPGVTLCPLPRPIYPLRCRLTAGGLPAPVCPGAGKRGGGGGGGGSKSAGAELAVGPPPRLRDHALRLCEKPPAHVGTFVLGARPRPPSRGLVQPVKLLARSPPISLSHALSGAGHAPPQSGGGVARARCERGIPGPRPFGLD